MIFRPRARAAVTTRSVASHQKLVGPPFWIEFQSTSSESQRAPLSATAWSIRPWADGDSQRIAEPGLTPARSPRREPGVLAWTPGVLACSEPGSLIALEKGIGAVSEHPASSDAPSSSASTVMMERRLATVRCLRVPRADVGELDV